MLDGDTAITRQPVGTNFGSRMCSAIDNEGEDEVSETGPTVQLDEMSVGEISEDSGEGSSTGLDDVTQPRDSSVGVDRTPLDDLDS